MSEVTTPIVRGRRRERALAERVEESLGLESLPQILQLQRGCPEPGRPHEIGDELHRAGAWVDREPAMHDDLVAKLAAGDAGGAPARETARTSDSHRRRAD